MNGEKKGKVLNHSSGIKLSCKIGMRIGKNKEKRTNQKKYREYKKKNLLLKQKERELLKIVSKIKFNEEVEPLPTIVKSELRRRR